jgi:hypothetical protein
MYVHRSSGSNDLITQLGRLMSYQGANSETGLCGRLSISGIWATRITAPQPVPKTGHPESHGGDASQGVGAGVRWSQA